MADNLEAAASADVGAGAGRSDEQAGAGRSDEQADAGRGAVEVDTQDAGGAAVEVDEQADAGRVAVEVDARGRPCPQPVIELAKAVKGQPVGAVVRLRADDPAAKVDIPVWCRMQRQRLVAQEPDDGGWVFHVEKMRDLG